MSERRFTARPPLRGGLETQRRRGYAEKSQFVNVFFENPTMSYLRRLKKQGADNGVAFVRITVDEEGPVAAAGKSERMQAAIAHRKWVDIARYLGRKDIRCNVQGAQGDWKQDKDFAKRAAESFNDLLEYSRGAGLDLCIENHGGASSNADVLISVIKAVDNPRLGTLPDFGNINKGDDRYEVIRRIVPYAKGISVKTSWHDDDTHPDWDLDKLLNIARMPVFTVGGASNRVIGPRSATSLLRTSFGRTN